MKISNMLIGLLLLFAACKNADTEKETPNGFKYTVLKSGDGVLPKSEEIIVFDFVMKDSKDSVWNDTQTEGLPSAIQIADSAAEANENGMVQMFRRLSKGDSVTTTMTVAKFFKDIVGAPVPQGLDSATNISYNIRVNDIMSLDEFRAYQAELMEGKRKLQETEDAELIDNYLALNNITALKDVNGIRYVIHTSKGRKKPSAENCVTVKYTGKFLRDGQIFDQGEKVAFPLNAVIAGWRMGIPLLGVGDSATLYIPSGLAYGPQGYPGAIPPDAVLIFDVELLGVGTNFDQTAGICK